MSEEVMVQEIKKSHITRLYSPELLKKLYFHALSIDIENNNEKVEWIKYLLGDDFSELGPGTNRLGMLGPDGYCHKIAMDRRGIVDNVTEFKRSPELEWVAPKVYECNGVVLVAENVELLTKEEFVDNQASILEICATLAEHYIFTDIGFAMKNFCNWGIRRNGDLVILDTGYLIPILGNEEAMTCPLCGRRLKYNRRYTGFTCPKCATDFGFIDVYRRLTNKLEDTLYKDITGFDLPDFSHLNDAMYNNGVMKGGHISSDVGEVPRMVSDDEGSGTIRYEDIKDILNMMEKRTVSIDEEEEEE